MPPFNISLSAFNVAVIGLGLNIGAYGAEVFFFFKQKTAYEIDMGLEFRRVLFRSTPSPRARPGRAAPRPGSGRSRRGHRTASTGAPSCPAGSGRCGRRGSRWAAACRPGRPARSEERRVGKEGRAGGTAEYEIRKR